MGFVSSYILARTQLSASPIECLRGTNPISTERRPTRDCAAFQRPLGELRSALDQARHCASYDVSEQAPHRLKRKYGCVEAGKARRFGELK